MLKDILPPEVKVIEQFNDDPKATLFVEERIVGKASNVRRQEFTQGRHCAHQAIIALGFPASPIGRGAVGEPIWPVEIIGSITHCRAYRAAAVAKRDDFYSIGIDAEIHENLPAEILAEITQREELAFITASSDVKTSWGCVLFSAKESVYKALFPLTNKWLGFDEVTVTFDRDHSQFSARISPAVEVNGHPLESLSGRYKIANGLVVTFVGLRNRRLN
jgi:4'-phosphopantetheinyl transferase EntD